MTHMDFTASILPQEHLLHRASRHTECVQEPDTGKVRQILEDPPKGLGEPMKFYTFNSSSAWLGSASWKGTIKIWDIHTGKVLQALESKDLLWTSCAFSPNGSLFAATSWNGTVKVWDIHTGKVLQTLESQKNSWTSCAFSPDGAWLTTSSWEGSLKIWEISNGTCIAAFYASGPLKWCAFCSDESTLVAASNRGLYFLDLVKK